MKKFCAALAAAVFALAPFTVPVHAQAGSPIVVDVPFGFEYGPQHFAPGRYALNMETDHGLLLRSINQHGLTLTQFSPSFRPSPVSKVVFHRVGDQYFLREVWTVGEKEYVACLETSAEKHALAQRLVAGQVKPAPANVEVAGR